MLCVSAAYTIAWCPSVRLSLCLSVTFVYYVKRVNIFSIFSPSGSHIILVFRIKRCGDILTGTWGKIRDFRPYLSLASITALPSRVVNISTVDYRL